MPALLVLSVVEGIKVEPSTVFGWLRRFRREDNDVILVDEGKTFDKARFTKKICQVHKGSRNLFDPTTVLIPC